jgi:NADH dehydrogenase (ubiquinone) 1 alpha subcomplex subunit 6
MIRLKIRQDFEKNKEIRDLPVIDMLLHKNQQEYQETMNCWKQEVSHLSDWYIVEGHIREFKLTPQPHLLHWFKSYEDPAPPQTFLEKFYAGRDDPKQVASF